MIRKIVRERPHRLPRECYRGKVFASFTARIEQQYSLFISHKTVGSFISMLDSARKKNDCIVLLYCFMPEHLHVIMQGQSEHADVYQAMLGFKQTSGFFLRKTRAPCQWQKICYPDFLDYNRRAKFWYYSLHVLGDECAGEFLLFQFFELTTIILCHFQTVSPTPAATLSVCQIASL